MKKTYFHAQQAVKFLDAVSLCLTLQADDIDELKLTTDYVDIDRLLFCCIAKSYSGSRFSYEQIPLLRGILTELCSYSHLLNENSDECETGLEFIEPGDIDMPF